MCLLLPLLVLLAFPALAWLFCEGFLRVTAVADMRRFERELPQRIAEAEKAWDEAMQRTLDEMKASRIDAARARH